MAIGRTAKALENQDNTLVVYRAEVPGLLANGQPITCYQSRVMTVRGAIAHQRASHSKGAVSKLDERQLLRDYLLTYNARISDEG